MRPDWLARASYPCSLEMSRRARLDASLLACRASATRSLSKSAKVSQTCCPFHSLFPDLPGLALLRLAPPLLSLLPRLQRHGILLRKKRRRRSAHSTSVPSSSHERSAHTSRVNPFHFSQIRIRLTTIRSDFILPKARDTHGNAITLVHHANKPCAT